MNQHLGLLNKFSMKVNISTLMVFRNQGMSQGEGMESANKYCRESWGMGAEEFRKAPMMQHKLTALTRTYLNPKPQRRRYIIENSNSK
jgi:hypothetical protein